MNWITNAVLPKIKALVTANDVPDNLWVKCKSCGQMIFHRELEKNIYVCQHCGHHMRIGADRRFKSLFDHGRYEAIVLPEALVDPLKFKDRKRYTDRLKDARVKNDTSDALAVAVGALGGQNAVIAVLDFAFMGGSMGIAVGDGLLTGARKAVEENVPFIVFSSSGGARMQEGVLSLMQLPRTILAVEKVRDAGLPHIVLLAHPTTGGVTASFAMLGDLQIAEPGAIIGFAGRRVIEETVREKLPEDFQTAEYLMDHGMVDAVVARSEQAAYFGKILEFLMGSKGSVKAA